MKSILKWKVKMWTFEGFQFWDLFTSMKSILKWKVKMWTFEGVQFWDLFTSMKSILKWKVKMWTFEGFQFWDLFTSMKSILKWKVKMSGPRPNAVLLKAFSREVSRFFCSKMGTHLLGRLPHKKWEGFRTEPAFRREPTQLRMKKIIYQYFYL